MIQKKTRTRRRLSMTCFVILLLTQGAGVSSAKKRCVHQGDGVKLIADIGDQYGDGSIYRDNGTYIASLSLKADNIKIEDVIPDYSGRIYIVGNRDIWLLPVEGKDDGKYFFNRGTDLKRLEMQLIVLGELTEGQLQECQNIRPDFPKKDFETSNYRTSTEIWNKLKGVNYSTMMSTAPKEVTEGNLTEEEMRKWLDDHPDFIKKYFGRIPLETDHRITAILVIAIMLGILLLVIYPMFAWIWYKKSERKLIEEYMTKLLKDHLASTGTPARVDKEDTFSESSDEVSVPISKEEQTTVEEQNKAQTESVEGFRDSITVAPNSDAVPLIDLSGPKQNKEIINEDPL